MQEDFFKAEKFGCCCFDCSIFHYKSLSYDIFCDGIFLDFFWVWGGFLKRFEKKFCQKVLPRQTMRCRWCPRFQGPFMPFPSGIGKYPDAMWKILFFQRHYGILNNRNSPRGLRDFLETKPEHNPAFPGYRRCFAINLGGYGRPQLLRLFLKTGLPDGLKASRKGS